MDPSALSLEITRTFKASPERVYAAWTDPVQLAQWWGPDDAETLSLEADVRVGGDFIWRLRTPDGEEMQSVGKFLELVPAERISFSWKWDDDEDWAKVPSTITVHLAPKEGGTEMRFHHVGFPSETSRGNHQGGWESTLGRLAKMLEAEG